MLDDAFEEQPDGPRWAARLLESGLSIVVILFSLPMLCLLLWVGLVLVQSGAHLDSESEWLE